MVGDETLRRIPIALLFLLQCDPWWGTEWQAAQASEEGSTGGEAGGTVVKKESTKTITLKVTHTTERQVLTERGVVTDRTPMVEITIDGSKDVAWGKTFPEALRHLALTIEWRDRIAAEKAREGKP